MQMAKSQYTIGTTALHDKNLTAPNKPHTLSVTKTKRTILQFQLLQLLQQLQLCRRIRVDFWLWLDLYLIDIANKDCIWLMTAR